MGRKNSAHTHRAHVEEVVKRIIEWHPPWKIKSELGREWNLSEKMMECLISEANKLIVETQSNWDEEYRKHIQRGHDIIRKAIEKGDYKTASQMFANLSRLGMEKVNLDVTSNGNTVGSSVVFMLPDGQQLTQLPEGPGARQSALPQAPETVQLLGTNVHDDAGPGLAQTRTPEELQNGAETSPE